MKRLESIKVTAGRVEKAEPLNAALDLVLEEIRSKIGNHGLLSMAIEDDVEGIPVGHIQIDPTVKEAPPSDDDYVIFNEFDIDRVLETLKGGNPVVLTKNCSYVQKTQRIIEEMVQMTRDQNPELLSSSWIFLSYNYPMDQKRARGWHVDGWELDQPTEPVHTQFTFGGVAQLEVAEGTHEVESQEKLSKMEFSETSLIPDYILIEIGNHLIHRIEANDNRGLRKVLAFI